MRRAFADVYRQNRVAVASMGNQAQTPQSETQYPAAFGQGILTVGASTNEDERADYSSRGSHIDVVAPGGGAAEGETASTTDYIYSTAPGSSYGYVVGTSFAAPVASGLAALMLSVNPNLYNDDIEQIIRMSADDKGPTGFDNQYGAGRVNARKALDLLRSPYAVSHYAATGGSIVSSTGTYTTVIYDAPGLASSVYIVKRHEVRRSVSFPSNQSVSVWGRGAASKGWNIESPNFSLPWVGVVPGTVTSTSATLRTYVYQVWDEVGHYKGYYPATAGNAIFAYTVHGIPDPLPDPPPAPTGLAISGSVGQHPHLTWNASTGATSYKVYRCSNISYLCSNFSYIGSTSNTYYTDTNKTLGTQCGSGPDEIAWYYVTAHNSGGASGPSNKPSTCIDAGKGGVASGEVAVPEVFALHGNHPNPFNPSTQIRFDLPEAAHVRLVVYDVLGREVARLVDREMEAGYQQVTWEVGNIPSGVYLYRIEAGSFSQSRSMILQK